MPWELKHKVTCAAALSLCLTAFSSGAGLAQETITVRIGAASNVLFGPVFVLADESTGIAAEHGLEIDARNFNSGIATMEAALAGELDIAFPNTRVLLPLLKSGQACFKAGIGFVDVNTVRMVTSVDIQEPQDLVGKQIGTRSGGIGEVALHLWMADKGLERDSVEIVNMAEEDQPIAMARGSVDGIIWPEPIPSLALEVAGDSVHRFGDIGSAFRDVSVVNVTCDWVEENGDEGMERLIAAWIDAVELLKNDPERGIEITASALQLSPEEVRGFWEDGGWPGGWPANLSDSQIDMYHTYGDYLKSLGELDEMPDMSNWISSEWLNEVAPDRVKLSEYDL